MKTTENRLHFLASLYRVNKKYCFGVVIFFIIYIIFPTYINSSLSPLFRNWEMFSKPEYIQTYYTNINIIANDTISLRNMHLNNSTLNVVYGQVHAYLNIRNTGNDGLYVMDSHTLTKLFPYYKQRQHNKVSDTTLFKQSYLSNLSRYLKIPINSATIIEEKIAYDKNGFAYIHSSTVLTDIRK